MHSIVMQHAVLINASQVLPALQTNARGKYSLYIAVDLPPMGFTTYFVAQNNTEPVNHKMHVGGEDQTLILENSFLMVFFTHYPLKINGCLHGLFCRQRSQKKLAG